MGRRVGLGDVGVRDPSFAKIVFQCGQCAIGVGVYRFIHRYLKDQVGATLQIESEVNIFLDGGDHPALLPCSDGFIRIGAKKDAVHEDQQCGDYE